MSKDHNQTVAVWVWDFADNICIKAPFEQINSFFTRLIKYKHNMLFMFLPLTEFYLCLNHTKRKGTLPHTNCLLKILGQICTALGIHIIFLLISP